MGLRASRFLSSRILSTLGVAVIVIASGARALAGPGGEKRGRAHGQARVLTQAEIDGFLETEAARDLRARAQQEERLRREREREAQAAAALERLRELTPAGLGPVTPGWGGRVHRAVIRRPRDGRPPSGGSEVQR